MKNTSLRAAISDTYAKDAFDTNTERIIASCLLYSFVKKAVESEYGNNARSIASSYKDAYKGTVLGLKNTYISYAIMVNKIENVFKKDSFLEMTEDEIREIKTLYLNKRKIEKFSSKRYSQFMYNIANLTYTQNERLRSIHYENIVPIIRYYADNYEITEDSMHIINAEVYEGNPGKAIIFTIDGILSSKIVSDIKSKNISIDFFELKTYGDYVKIIFA